MNQLVEKTLAASGCTNDPSVQTIAEFFRKFDGSAPSKNLDSLRCAIEALVQMLSFYGTIVFGIMVLYSAFLYVSSLGEEAKAETAKKTLIWSIVGFILLGLATIFETVLKNTIKNS